MMFPIVCYDLDEGFLFCIVWDLGEVTPVAFLDLRELISRVQHQQSWD